MFEEVSQRFRAKLLGEVSANLRFTGKPSINGHVRYNYSVSCVLLMTTTLAMLIKNCPTL